MLTKTEIGTRSRLLLWQTWPCVLGRIGVTFEHQTAKTIEFSETSRLFCGSLKDKHIENNADSGGLLSEVSEGNKGSTGAVWGIIWINYLGVWPAGAVINMRLESLRWNLLFLDNWCQLAGAKRLAMIKKTWASLRIFWEYFLRISTQKLWFRKALAGTLC